MRVNRGGDPADLRGEMADRRHTLFAGRALSLAELFEHSVARTRVPGPVTYAPALSGPEGESTGGGKQAVQHVTLVPLGGGPTLLMGSANIVEHRLELRTWDYLGHVHRQRWKGAKLPIPRAAYDATLETVRTFFLAREFTVTLLDAPPAPTSRRRTALLIAAALALAVALALVVR